MCITIKSYLGLPEEARAIRIAIFMKEQGFVDEFDAIDPIATHLVCFKDETPIGCCRLFSEGEDYIFGRLAVLADHRGQHLGSRILTAAEDCAREIGAKALRLHAQCQAQGFYEKLGYTAYGDIEPEEGCPHIWMKKML